MVEIFAHYAKYNSAANMEMIKIMENASVDAYDYPVEGFFKSAGEILDHLYVADVIWLNAVRTVREFSIHKDSLFGDVPDYGRRMFRSLAGLKDMRSRLDELFLRMTDELTESDLFGTISRINRKGEKQEKILWKALMHVFNHQTHHRAQVGQILEQLKIANDYSNLIRIE